MQVVQSSLGAVRNNSIYHRYGLARLRLSVLLRQMAPNGRPKSNRFSAL